MRYGLSIPNFTDPSDLVEIAVAADHGGWDGMFLWDHAVGAVGMAIPISDPWTVLGAVARETKRIRLGTLITPVPRRRPWVLARQVTTVDLLSDGRVTLAVGLGERPEAEYSAVGEPADRRRHGQLLDEGLDIIDALWSGQPVTYHGTHHHLEMCSSRPGPGSDPARRSGWRPLSRPGPVSAGRPAGMAWCR